MKKYDTVFLCLAICAFSMVLGIKVFSARVSNTSINVGLIRENQTSEPPYRVISPDRTFPNQPIQIIEVKVKGRYVALSNKFKEDDEWLKGISWKIKNITDKEIVAIYSYLEFPKTSTMERGLIVMMNYIADPTIKNTDLKKPLKFNESAKFTLSNERYTKLKPLLESKMPLSEIKHIKIHVDLVVFNDDTAWSLDQKMYRDPNNPQRWIVDSN